MYLARAFCPFSFVVTVVSSTVSFPSNTSNPAGACLGHPFAQTRNGTACGLILPHFSQDIFLGIPYAKAPVAELRFRPPQPHNETYTPLHATTQPASCSGYAGFDVGIGPLSEDCLYMNVVRPSVNMSTANQGAGLPVLVWIYGGGFDAGGIADPRFNMSYLVSQSVKINKPVIGVSFNYRVGGWGFLASTEVLEAGVTNLGLRDQRLALHYIRENIAGFGGDPERVTIWGESAGAFSVGYHLTMFDGHSDNLFRAAILESGSALGPALQNIPQLAQKGGYQELYDNVTRTVGCQRSADSLDCLRHVPHAILFEAFRPQVYTPILDGVIIRRLPSEQFSLNQMAPVALLLGSNTDEGTASFWGPRYMLNSTEDVRSWIKTLNGGGLNDSDVSELLALYPDDPTLGCPFGTGFERFAGQGWMYKRGTAIATDIFVAAGRRHTAKAFAARNDKDILQPVYSYRFDQTPWNGVEELITTIPPVYSTHFSEVSYVFNNPSSNLSNWFGPFPPHHDLSTLMSRAWVSFAHSLDPNQHLVDHVPHWPLYSTHDPKNMVFRISDSGSGPEVEPDTWREVQLAWWADHWSKLRT